MFVFNEVSHDRRVLKEADALQAAGWSVTIHGIRQRRSKASVRENRTSGVVIARYPLSMFQIIHQDVLIDVFCDKMDNR
mgnify:CR=1 FL=1